MNTVENIVDHIVTVRDLTEPVVLMEAVRGVTVDECILIKDEVSQV